MGEVRPTGVTVWRADSVRSAVSQGRDHRPRLALGDLAHHSGYAAHQAAP